MKLIITGANGFLGQHLAMYMYNDLYDIYPVSRGVKRIPKEVIPYYQLELTDKQAVLNFVSQIKPDCIIHTAAMSKPDECFYNQAECILQNVTATEYLIEAAQQVSARFIYVSTDFIYGEGGPHSEDAIPAPLNFYGESKLMAENLVKNSGLRHNIIRPVFIYGAHWDGMRPSFIQWVKLNLEANKKIKVVTDQLRTPTYVGDICKGIDLLMQHETNEDFHFAGSDILSPYEMAVLVAKVLGFNKDLIEPVTADSFPEIVKRAKKSGLKIEKAFTILGYQPQSYEEGVRLSFY